MALSGLDIFKLLPKTNCGDCGVPTCMALAMKLAQKKADLRDCPHASADAQKILGAAAEPPIRSVKINKAKSVEIGNETVMFRHEKTFVHPTAVAIRLLTSQSEDQLLTKIREIEKYKLQRVGEELEAELFFLSHNGEDGDDFFKALKLIQQNSTKGIILDCPDKEMVRQATELLKDAQPAIFLRGEVTDRDIEIAKAGGASLILTGFSLDDLAKQAEKTMNSGLKNIILHLESRNLGTQMQSQTILRRSALKRNFKPFGFPLFAYVRAENSFDLLARASLLLCKYASVIVLPEYDKALLHALLTLRQNIYTDPQKPIQVDPRCYPIGEPTAESPVFVTTNFSLTYFIVSGEIENAGISAHLLVVDTEGQSVLTAWAAGKFGGEKIAQFIKKIKLEETVKTRKIVIPGFVSQISGDLEEHLPRWEVIVGCQEASDIPAFIKNVKLI